MSYLKFLSFNVFGGIGWVVLLTTAGYYLGSVEFVRRHFEKVIMSIILISVMPIFIEYFKSRRRKAAAPVAEIEKSLH